MTNISENITQTDIDAATEANRAVLQERFPDLDISVGGPVDSLLVDGNVVITAQNDANVDKAYLYQQLKAVSEGTVTIPDEDLDRLMANYFLTRQEAIVATGTVVFVVRDNTQSTFQAGYRLTSSGQSYQLGATYTVYPVGTTNVDFTVPTNVLMEQIFDAETGYQFQYELPIESVDATPSAVRVSGDRFEAAQPFDGLGYIQAVTNFQGGTAAETNEQFAKRGLQGLLAKTVGGQDHIDALVREAVPLADSNSIGVNDPLMTRDRANVFNISTGGRLDVYVKSGAIAQAGYVVTGVVLNDVARTVSLTLTREQSAGVYRTAVTPVYLSAPPTIVSGGITVQSVVHNVWTDPEAGAFNPLMPADIDRAFSTRQEIVITIVDDRQTGSGYYVDMTPGPGTEIEDAYSVGTEYQPGCLLVDDILMGPANRPPGVDVLVKAAVPCIVTIGITAKKPANYNGPGADVLAAEVASAINLLPVETADLDGFTISNILKTAAPQLVLTGLSMAGTIYGQDGTNISVPQLGGKLTIVTNTTAKVSSANCYYTTTPPQVSVTLV
jgi:hypothetical protein